MNFQEFEQLLKGDVKKITLTEDVVLEVGEEENYKRGIEINTNDLIINGNGHVIDGNKKASLLDIKTNVTLENISLKNGYCEYSGGAINNEGDLIIKNCEFLENSCDDFGGAIYNASNSKLAIKRSKFKENRSDYGGAVYMDSNSISNVDGSVFESNSSEFEGGAIFNKAKLLIYGSLFKSNASFKGGAIYNEGISNIKYCDFENNIASEGNDIKSENDKNLRISVCNFN